MKIHIGDQPKHISKHIINLLYVWDCQEPPTSRKRPCNQPDKAKQAGNGRVMKRAIYVKN